MATIDEHDLRDKIARNLDVLEAGLTLVNKEAYLPHPLGTRSFVDLLAIDGANRYVLIELKRSGEASREAIHEIYKYVEAAKSHLGARNDELRVLLVSIEWKELLVPSSRFVADTTITVAGLILDIDGQGRITSKYIELLPISHGRYIAPWHDLNMYHDAASLARGLEEYERYSRTKGIQDYVLVVLQAAPDFNETARERSIEMYRDMMASIGSPIDDAALNSFVDRLGDFEYILYFAMRQLTWLEGLSLIRDESTRIELEEYYEYAGEEDGIRYLHENLRAMEPRPHYDHYEIGYPTKLRTQLLEIDGWTTQNIKRYGLFERNIALSDEEIINELCALDGSTQQILTRVLNISDISQFRAAQDGIRSCLRDSPRWQGHILRALDEIKTELPSASVKVHIYNPCSGIITLFLIATHGRLYMPHYYVHASENGHERVYVGFLHFQPPSLSFADLLNKYYGGALFPLLGTLIWGGYESRDTDIFEDVGLTYRTARINDPDGERELFVLRDERWYKETNSTIQEGLMDFFQSESELIDTVIYEIGSRWNGGSVNAFDEKLAPHGEQA